MLRNLNVVGWEIHREFQTGGESENQNCSRCFSRFGEDSHGLTLSGEDS